MSNIVETLKQFKKTYPKVANFDWKKQAKHFEKASGLDVNYAIAAKISAKKGKKTLTKNTKAAISFTNDSIIITAKGFASSIYEKLPKQAVLSIGRDIKMLSATISINMLDDFSISFSCPGRLVPNLATELELAMESEAVVEVKASDIVEAVEEIEADEPEAVEGSAEAASEDGEIDELKNTLAALKAQVKSQLNG